MVEQPQKVTQEARDEPEAVEATRYFGAHAEVITVTGALLLFGVAVSDWFTFFALAPSPLLLPVLWGALRGGLMPAMTATIFASLLHALGAVVAAGQDFSVLTSDSVTWTLLAFAIVAYVVGQTRDLLVARLMTLRRTRERLQFEGSRQRGDIEVLEHANRELKRRIFDRSFDFDSLVATVARSTIDDDEHMFEGSLGMLTDFCGATKCSALLVLPDDTLDLAAHRGWEDEEIGTRLQIANNSTRVLRAIVEARPIVDLSEEEGDIAGPLLIAPIADGTGVIKALICVDEMPPSRFEESSVKTFLGIVSWLATNVRRIQMREATGENSQQVLEALDQKKYIGTTADLAERIHLEDARRKRYGVETEIIAIRLLDTRVNMADYITSLEEYLVRVLGTAVRLSDDIFAFGLAGCYVLVLTGCKQGHGASMVSRLYECFDADAVEDIGPVDLHHFDTTTEAPTLTDLLPVLTEHFCGASPVHLAQQCPVPEPRAQRSGNAEEFARRLRLETDLARRYGVELNMIDFRREGAAFGIGPMVARHLWNAVGTLLRVTDGIYVVSPNRCVVLLPFTTCVDASTIWSRLEETLRRTLPKERYDDVRADFLALDASNIRQTVQYLVGAAGEEAAEERAPMLTENELEELTFSDAEYAGMQPDHDVEKGFRVIASSRANVPTLPSPEAITRRWEQVFARDAAAPSKFLDSDDPRHGAGTEFGDGGGDAWALDDSDAESAEMPTPEEVAKRWEQVFQGDPDTGAGADGASTETPGEFESGSADDASGPETGSAAAGAESGGPNAESVLRRWEQLFEEKTKAAAEIGELEQPGKASATTDTEESEATEPEGRKPEVREPEAQEPETSEPAAGEPEANKPEANKPEVEEPQSREAQSREADSSAPDSEPSGFGQREPDESATDESAPVETTSLESWREAEEAAAAAAPEPEPTESANDQQETAGMAAEDAMTRTWEDLFEDEDQEKGDQPPKRVAVVKPTPEPDEAPQSEEKKSRDSWWQRVGDLIEDMAKTGQAFTSSEVRMLAKKRRIGEPRHGNAWGAVLATAVGRGLIERTGRKVEPAGARPNASRLTEWVGRGVKPVQPELKKDVPVDADKLAAGDPETLRVLLNQIESLAALCARLSGQLPEDVRD